MVTAELTQIQFAAVTSILAFLGGVWNAISRGQPQCRSIPGDEAWPSPAEWDAFNQTVEGKLIATVPIASPCHDTFPGVAYDAERCASIRDNWARPELHDRTTHSPMAAFFANESCDPFTAANARCTVGAYISYAVNASNALDYQKNHSFRSGQKHTTGYSQYRA